ncbi:Uncharacterized protein ChrSV_4430 [Chromobacterium vaccinii]|nr:Uncharacterized protein ChrSW_4430 [Chromobacterium vaccinii]QND91886.1 Uncharacterized protein ChrSV_4430 [Chromobacterium vaccinii]
MIWLKKNFHISTFNRYYLALPTKSKACIKNKNTARCW